MSTQLISNKQLNYISSELSRLDTKPENKIYLSYSGTMPSELEVIMQKLRTWNYQAWNERYPSEKIIPDNQEPYKYQHIQGTETVQCLKFCESLYYNCTDAKHFDNSESEQ